MSDSKEHAYTLFVSKIPNYTKEEDFQALFPESYRCFITKSSFSKKFRVGYVYYSSSELYQKALQSKYQLPNGPVLTVKPAHDKASSLSNKKEALKRTSQIRFDRKVAKEKQSRIILRNLSFKASEEDIKTVFSKHGALKHINILTKPDGKRVGCAFLQYENRPQAAKAIKAANGSNFMGRPVALDWAVPKKDFQATNSKTEVEVKNKDVDHLMSAEEDNGFGKDDKNGSEDDEDGFDGEDENMSVDGEEKYEDDSERDSEDDDKDSRPKWESGHDVDEGRTVFIRNLSFDSLEEDLASLIEERYGEVVFAKFVMDKIKEHPKGTAFVKFVQTKSAERAVNDKEPLILDDRTIYLCMAMKKSDADSINKKKEMDKKLGKDKRNLHLAREGLIREGTRAAVDVSKTDLHLRTKIQKWKTNMLKDLSCFVSPVRLCVRNIPEDFNDKRLRNLFSKYGVLSEAKVIRDEKMNPAKGNAELGFVTFKEHEHALNALRAVNNNPTIFRKDCRPIVEFSIENLKAIKAREKRLQKSRENNPNFKKINTSTQKTKPAQTLNKKMEDSGETVHGFMGSKNDPKQKNLPSHIGPKVRSARPKISRKDLKKGAKRKVLEKKIRTVPIQHKKDKTDHEENNPEKKKKNKKKVKPETLKELKEEKSFNSLVQNYKTKLLDNYEPMAKRRKWFAE
ncbi:RNA-binding protein 28 [Lepeophtheirus salmonis]|uniref:RNA-binding protein 28 n=1 Tax=Lepeophtheirus salmonis TaxID=72036 RepID=UPI001AE6464D|nr:RNA-binding protein 28-like [Lepeophtheirus salmonis]